METHQKCLLLVLLHLAQTYRAAACFSLMLRTWQQIQLLRAQPFLLFLGIIVLRIELKTKLPELRAELENPVLIDKLREHVAHLLQKLRVVVDRVLPVPLLVAKYVDPGPLGLLVILPHNPLIGVIHIPLVVSDVVIVLALLVLLL